MYFTYRPGDGEQQRWDFNPKKLLNFEAEQIEKRTGWTYDEFCVQLQKGSTLARRALLWTLQRRAHPKVRFEDVTFAMDEVELSYSKSELEDIKTQMEGFDFDSEPERQMALKQVDKLIAEAEEDPSDPKANGNSAG